LQEKLQLNIPIQWLCFYLVKREQFSNKNWCYLWLEWFWIVRYSQVETPRMAAKMLQALDDGKGKISSRQIKNRKEPTLKFLEEFFHYFRLFLLFEIYILQIIKEDEFLKKDSLVYNFEHSFQICIFGLWIYSN
jgi:hypothetical protein